MTTKEYQGLLKGRLEHLFPDLEIMQEWVSFTRQHAHYSPNVDIAFSPFSIQPNETKKNEFDALVQEPRFDKFLRALYQFHCENMNHTLFANEYELPDYERVIYKNENARCFIAVEIENKNSKKHMMGSIINAASLGRIGIGVAYCDSAFRTMARILHYLAFLKRVEKNTYDTTNFLLLKPEQLERCFSVR